MSGREDDPLPRQSRSLTGARAGCACGCSRARVARVCPDSRPGSGPGRQGLARVQGAAGRRRLPREERVLPGQDVQPLNATADVLSAPSGRPVDVMVDRLVMSHAGLRPSFGNSCSPSTPPTCCFSKLQSIELNAKDARDITYLLSGCRSARRRRQTRPRCPVINKGRFGEVLAADWGGGRTTTGT